MLFFIYILVAQHSLTVCGVGISSIDPLPSPLKEKTTCAGIEPRTPRCPLSHLKCPSNFLFWFCYCAGMVPSSIQVLGTEKDGTVFL